MVAAARRVPVGRALRLRRRPAFSNIRRGLWAVSFGTADVGGAHGEPAQFSFRIRRGSGGLRGAAGFPRDRARAASGSFAGCDALPERRRSVLERVAKAIPDSGRYSLFE